jgi:carbonic anhydrase
MSSSPDLLHEKRPMTSTDPTAASTGQVDPDIQDAIEGHARFRALFERDREFYRALASAGQKPRLLWIGCADSRVVPAQITSADPGELFEIRNIANTVPPSWADDDSVGAAVEYAVAHLGVDDIVVCGHTGCGGIAAQLSGDPPAPESHLGRWIDFAAPARKLVEAARVPASERLDAAVKAHVQFQIDNLMTYAIVKDRLASGRLSVHGWLYDMERGELFAYDGSRGDWLPLIDRHGPTSVPAQ